MQEGCYIGVSAHTKVCSLNRKKWSSEWYQNLSPRKAENAPRGCSVNFEYFVEGTSLGTVGNWWPSFKQNSCSMELRTHASLILSHELLIFNCCPLVFWGLFILETPFLSSFVRMLPPIPTFLEPFLLLFSRFGSPSSFFLVLWNTIKLFLWFPPFWMLSSLSLANSVLYLPFSCCLSLLLFY